MPFAAPHMSCSAMLRATTRVPVKLGSCIQSRRIVGPAVRTMATTALQPEVSTFITGLNEAYERVRLMWL